VLALIAQSTATVIQPPAELEFVLSTKSLAPATLLSFEYNPTSKLVVPVPEPRYQPISVIFVAPTGLVCFVTTELPSIVVLDPAGSAVGATVTKPQFVPSVSAILYCYYNNILWNTF